MTLTHQEIFQRYVHAGPMSRDPDALAELFTEDGVFEAPLVPEGHALPRRMVGREEIRTGLKAYYQRGSDNYGTVNTQESRFVLHETADPAVFIVELDTVLDAPDGRRTTMSLVQIFRTRDNLITHLRDYFPTPQAT
ncbi:nuclear transport factor 2 family protein [Allokutzneria sp. NRRL B-24872]|uniref:nuclear transport factor 2 family protein n=1 Tax=Allokutzneria sp. NRRL B-24872 TaxID=1137961 RepID=UPI001AEFE0A0|nr:nuclear transport factor 2 family protein [Allokutzneria sp. NRRL B-24872]